MGSGRRYVGRPPDACWCSTRQATARATTDGGDLVGGAAAEETEGAGGAVGVGRHALVVAPAPVGLLAGEQRPRRRPRRGRRGGVGHRRQLQRHPGGGPVGRLPGQRQEIAPLAVAALTLEEKL